MGIVSIVREASTGKLFAAKFIRNNSYGIVPEAIREIVVLKKLKHESIIVLHDEIYRDDDVILIMELMATDLQ